MRTQIFKTLMFFLLLTATVALPTTEVKAWKLFGKEVLWDEEGAIDENGCVGTHRVYRVWFLGIKIQSVDEFIKDDPYCGAYWAG